MTSIEWVKNNDGSDGKTWNPIRASRMVDDGKGGKMALRGWHCEHVHEGCSGCYAGDQNEAGFRGGTKLPYKPGHRNDVEIFLDEKVLLAPLRWRKPTKIFPCSMTDLFGDWVPDEWLDKIYAVMALCPQHTWIVLTKRPRRMRDYLATALDDGGAFDRIILQMMAHVDAGYPTVNETCERFGIPWTKARSAHDWWPLNNVWQMVSCSEQKDADEFVPLLLDTPAAVRGVSLEPLLGPIDLTALALPRWRKEEAADANMPRVRIDALRGYVAGPDERLSAKLDWAITGGESGPNGRCMHLDWEQSLREQCERANVPYFRKQWGAWAWAPEDLNYEQALAWGRAKFGQRVSYKHHSSGHTSFRVGKKKSGALRDGVAHMAWPEARS